MSDLNALKKLQQIQDRAGKTSTSATVSKEADKSSRAVLKRITEKVTGNYEVNQDFINTFINDANTFFSSVEDEYSKVGWSTATDSYFKVSGRWNDLNARSKAIRNWLDTNKSNLDEESYLQLTEGLDKYSSNATSVLDTFKNAMEFYSQFETADAYNQWNKNYEETRALLNSEDFEHYSRIGANITNPKDINDVAAPIDIFGWKPFGEGEKVGNAVTMSRANADYIAFMEANGGNTADYGLRSIYQFMEDDEVAIYNYYLGKGDTQKAEEYLASLEDTLQQKLAGNMVAKADNTALELVFSFGAGLEQFASGVRSLDDLIMGTVPDEQVSASQYAFSEMNSNNKGIWKVSNDLLTTTGNMLPSILAGSLTGGLGGALTLGASASGNAYAEMRHLGYDRGQASAYAGLVGASETALQYALGGIGKLGGKVSGNAVANLVSKFDNAIAKTAIKIGGNMASEGLEEAIQTVLEPAFKALVTGEDFEAPEWEEVWYSALLGALTAGVMEGVPTAIGTVDNNINAKRIYGDITEDILIEAANIGGTTTKTVDKYINKYGKKGELSGGNISHLLEITDTAKIRAIAESKLTQYGETGDIGKIADVITKIRTGEKITKAERNILVNSEFGRRVSTELNPDVIEAGTHNTSWTGDIGTRLINADVYNRSEGQTPNKPSSKVKPNVLPPEDEKKIEDAKVTIERDGKEVEVNIDKIDSIDNGEISVKLESGETVNVADIKLGGQMALVYQAASDMATRVGGFNVDTANVFVKGYDPNGNMTAAEYVHGFSDAYRFGKLGYPVSELESGVYTSKLTDEQRTRAYNFGKAFGIDKVADKQANVSRKGDVAKKGKVYFDGKTYGKNLTERQRASLKGLRVVAEALGIDIHIFESPKNADGTRTGENGWYDPSDNSIHIDLYAGVEGESLMLFTAAHELTHHIREVSPAKFKIFADALLEGYAKDGISVDELIEAKMDFLREKGRITSDMTAEQAYDLAYEEVVADSCEAMLVDSNAIEVLSKKLYAKDKGLWQTIKDFIAKLVSRIKNAYAGKTPDSFEGMTTRTMKSIENIQKLWVEALVDTSEHTTSAEITLAENGIMVDSKTDSASLMSVRDLLGFEKRQQVSKALAERFGVTQSEAMEWLKAETALASLILNPKYSQYLDYTADANEEAIKSNSDYPQGTVDFSNICKKRRDFTEVMNRVLRNFPNHVFAATDLAKIRSIMEEEGMEVACAICYVEDRRQLDSVVAQDFIGSLALYRNGSKTRPDGKNFNANQLKAFKLIEGDSYTPSIYELISLEGRNSLKAKNPAMEEAWVKFNNARGMQSVRLLLNDAEYKRQILNYTSSVVKRKNDLGGLRIYSFSDMEMFHLIDIIQVITDSATVGLSLQGYTKVNEYAKAVKDTGEKLNRSLIPKGDLGYHIEDGRVVLDFDTVEGIDINHPDFFDNIDNPNIGNIVIGINATQIKAAMTSKFIDQIIPFHTGQSNEVLGEKGIAAWDNYKDFQSERDAKTKKKSSHQINIYTEVINAAEAEGHPITNKVEFVNKFLEVCKENNLIPRFSDFLNVDENGNYIYTEGYHKFLVDFKTFDQNTGEYLPQMPVKPIFDNEYITKLLNDYVKSQKVKDAEAAKAMPKVLDRITKEIVNPKNSDVKYSLRVKRTNGTEIIANPYETTREQTLEYMRMSRKGQLENYTYFPVSSDTSKTIIATLKNAGIDIENRPLAMQADKARQSQIDAKPIHKNGFTIRYHAMSAEKILEVIDNLGEAVAIIHQRNRTTTKVINGEKQVVDLPDNFAVFVALEDGKEYVAVIEFDAEIKSDYILEDGKGDKYHTTVTVFEPDVERDGEAFDYIEYLLLREDNQELDIIKENPDSEAAIRQTEATAPEKEFSDNSIPQSPNSVKRKFSDRASQKASYAPTFYSHMGKVIDGIRLEKMGAGGVVSYLKGKGVKDEEIKWSGIEAFLEGKKSVTKADLQEFVAGSQLQIEEEMSGAEAFDIVQEGEEYIVKDKDGNILDTWFRTEAPDDPDLKGWMSEEEGQIASTIEEIREYASDWYGDGGSRWSQYRLDGGSNYRELVFKMPNSSYTNNAMRGHWGQDAEGVLAHARIQDFEVDGKRMLFIEEIQSDWHNEGHSKGYSTKEYEDAVESHDKLYNEYKKLDLAFHKYVRSNEFMTDPEDVRKKKHEWLRGKAETAQKKYLDAEKVVEYLKEKGAGDTPDAPFKDTYHEYVLKRLLRMAAEEGYDSIGWTTADIQSKRWSEDYAEGYRIEYDQDMPKFLRKYGKKWGATVGKSYVNPVENSEEYIADNEKDIAEYKRQIEEIGEDASENEYVQFLTEGIADLQANIEKYKGTKVWSMDITDSMKDSVLYEGQVFYSDRVTDKKTLNFLDNQEHVTVYRAMQVIDGELYPPMAAKVKSDNGKKSLVTPSKIGAWEQAVERPDLIRNGNKFELDKANGSSIQAAYNPYFHTSASPLNDQFSSAYKRPNLVIVEGEIPVSELTSGYRAEFAKDTVGETKWHSGPVASKLKGDKARRVFLSRWFKPVRIVPDSEVASIVAKTLEGENIDVPYNVITPSLRAELEKAGVPIKYQDRNTDSYSNRSLLANALETAAQNDIEREKLRQYKEKINLINSEEQKLHDLREQIKELSFKKGPRDTEAIKSLQFEANQAANRINTYDRQLLNLESTKALKGVIEREKDQARKRAEQKGKEALARYKEKAAETQRELMTRYQESRKKSVESRNKTAMRHKIKDIVSELNTLLLNPTAKKHIKEELRKEVADALSAINMDTVDADARVAKYNALIAKESDPDIIAELTKTRDNIQLQGENLKEKLIALQNAYEKIKATEDIELSMSYQEVIHNSIKNVTDKVGNTSIRNMTLEQLEMVYDLFKMIRHTIRDANKSFKAKKGETIMQMAEAVNDQVRTVAGQPYKRNAIIAGLQRVGWTFLKPFVAFRTIGSVTLTNMYKELRHGEDVFYWDVKAAQAFIEEQYKKHNYQSWDMKKTTEFTAKSGKNFKLTLEQMMSLYAYSRREQAHKHIIEGGIVFEDALIVEKNKWGIPIKYEVTTKDAFNLSEETFAEIANSLTAEQKAFVDAMQDYLSTVMGEKGNEVSMELLGVKLFKEKFYLPIKSSQYYRNFSAEEAGEVKLKSPAFSKETVKHANNPIVLHNFTDLWAEHINDMAMYHSFVLALEDFTRVYNYKTKTDDKVETMDTKATLETAYPGVTKYISKFLKDMNGGVRGETVGWADKLTSLAKKGSVLGSASVAIQQPSAVMRAMAMINPKYFVTTAHKSLNLIKHKQDWAELKKYAPIAGIKEMGRFDVGMGQGTVDWIQSNKTLLEKGEDILSATPAFMDEVTWVTIWNAVKRETAHKNPTLKTSSEEFLKLAGERFTDVVSMTQVYDSVFSRSDLMRNKSWIAKAVTSFMAEPTTTLNMIWDAWVQAKRVGGFKAYAKATATTGAPIVASIVLNAALKSIVMAMRDDDEDESYGEKYLEHFFGDLKDNLNPLTLVPIAKDVVSIFKGYDVERMDMALFSDLKKAIDAFDSDSKTTYEKWSGLVGAISAFCGVPVKNVERDIRAVINTLFGESEDTTSMGILNAIEEGWTGEEKSNGQQLYEAMIKGDTEQIERVKGRFENESDINTAIRKALRENDPRIKEAAKAVVNGNGAVYARLVDEIVNEGNFERKIVTGAIATEVDNMNPSGIEDYYTALASGDNQTAYAVKKDIIAKDVAVGKDREEAEASFNSKFVSHIRGLYEEGDISDYEAKRMLTNYGGKSDEEASSKVQYWDFKQEYPDYDLTEDAVKKYYSEVKPSGISVEVYYDYSKQRAKCKGTDSDGDGKTDSGSVKSEVMAVINSLPISTYQKDVLYFLNGWAESKLYEAPWH